MLHELKSQFPALLSLLDHVKSYLKYSEICEKIRQIEAELEEPSFWDNNPKAQDIFQNLTQLKAKKTAIDELESMKDDISTYFELYDSAENDLDTECITLFESFKKTIEQLEIECLFTDKYSQYNCIFSITAGAGGTDAQDWADILLRMFCRYFDKKNFRYTLVESNQGDEAGIKSATLMVQGEHAYGYLKNEMGVHRLVRLSLFNANNKRQTSFAAVDVIPDIQQDTNNIQIPIEDCRIDTFELPEPVANT